ncbi:MAG: type II secretion system F family protein [Deltaproteobacteria bacterium]|nr:type II secretion system F family protein [Deltaproteobacteria bacterium]
MPVYKWVGKNKKGETKKGELEAENENSARFQLRRMQITPDKLKAKPKDLFENVAFLQPGVTEKDIVIFTRQFSTMIDAGLPLVQCLEILSAQNENKTFKIILKTIKSDVESGSTLAEAMKKHPKAFDELFTNLVAAGELGGILDVILQRLANYIEKSQKLKRKVKGAMTYPAVVMVIAAMVVTVIMIFVIPVFSTMFTESGRALPLPTQIVIDLSTFIRKYFILVIIAIGLLAFAFKKFRGTAKGRLMTDSLFLKAPVFGPLLKKVAVAKFSRTLSTMVSSGVPILDGLDVTAKTSGNKIIEGAILAAKAAISEGRSISEPLSETKVFPSMVVQMIAVGESTGELDTMLEKIADFYDDEVDVAVEGLTAMLEPLLMVFLGGTIGGLVIAMYLPIFQMASLVGTN